MGKLISQIQNYPLSAGAVAYSNKLLLDDTYAIQQNKLKDYLKFLFEISRNIYFFNEMGTNSNTWNDLLRQDIIFQFARFLTIDSEELRRFFIELPQSNYFNSDGEITQSEYETLCYQRLQIIQYLFWLYKTISETITEDSQPQIASILKNDTITKAFIQYKALLDECLRTSLIKNNNKINVAHFNEIVFTPIEDSITNALEAYYNLLKTSGNQVLNVYSTDFDKIKAANEYAYSIFRSLLQIHQTFSFWAASKLSELTTTNTSHSPHSALLIAFSKLKLMYDARFNQLIHQHTSFVYNDILQLKKQPALPDTAYVSIELAKNVNQYLVEKDTLFKAGKNSQNKTVYYKATRDIVLNNAKIAELKSFVRIIKQNQLTAVCATGDAANKQWQVNNAWLPFNDIAAAWSGIGFESKLIESVSEKDTQIIFEFAYNKIIPTASDLKEQFEVKIMLEDDTEENLDIKEVIIEASVLSVCTSVVKNLTKAVKKGINARLKLVSPGKDGQNNGFVSLYQYLLSEPIRKVKVKMNKQQFVPGSVQTATATFGSSQSFIAFGPQSLAGSSFRIAHPYLKFAKKTDLTINWAESLEKEFQVNQTGDVIGLQKKQNGNGSDKTTISGFNNNNKDWVLIKLETNITYKINVDKLVEIPKALQVKSIIITADLEEDIYENENALPLKYIEIITPNFLFKSLYVPFIQKAKQKEALAKRYKESRIRITREHHNNLLAHLYPLGELPVYPANGFSFLPDYTKNGFLNFEADLYVGLTNIIPGQSVSLLFDIADETAAQSKLEAKISWYYLKDNSFEKIDASKIIDTTANFLQTGIVQLSLPEDATNNNTIVAGKNIFWLIARCDHNYEVVANIKNIQPNAISVTRILDENNQETKITVAPDTIENIFPKTANIKAVAQNTPSQNGREVENDKHFFWRSSQRLRHKQRTINQWDFEQIVLEKFSNIYKVKCLNHAFYNEANMQISAKATHTLIALLPHYSVNMENVNFQPAIPMSKLVEIKTYLQSKTTPFNQLQVLNTNWDVIHIEINATLNKGITDIPFYRQKLDEDLKRLLAPWAFEQNETILFNNQKMYMATIVDFIDELPYIHHIQQLRIYKNGIEQFDEVLPTSEIHLLTSAFEHTVNVVEYAD